MSEDRKASEGVWRTLPRREKLSEGAADFEHPPQMTVVSFKAGALRTIGRVIRCLYAAAYYFFWRFSDRLRGKDTEEARAVHLRKAFENVGGTFIKLGQQLSLRADLLPYAYCRELSKLLDNIEPFDAQWAARAIKDTCGKELEEVFSAFDPEPIGSASIACVFQAQLKDGSSVAVKVRRPGIGEVFTADFRALDWVANVLEFFTILRPGFSEGIRKGIRASVMEEMDFRREARYQELFRRSAKKRKKNFISAPRVYPEYSGDNVIVMELVTEGLKLSEVLAAVDQPTSNPRVLAVMNELRIKPRIIAKRLLWANYAGMITDLFFHGDPSPGNIFVQKKSRLMFIDFGSCGAFNQSQRRALKQINYHQSYGDAEGMATASLTLLEPLPPIDIDSFRDELEGLYQLSLYAMESKHAKWWERTTAVQWYHFLRAALAYKIPLPPVILRMARATLLYDTVAARLDADIVFYDEYRRYERFARKLGGQKIREQIEEQLANGIDDSQFMIIDKIMRTGNRAIYQFERLLDLQPFKFIADIEKAAYVVLSLLKMVLKMVLATIVIVPVAGLVHFILKRTLSFDFEFVWSVLKSPWYLGAMSLIVLQTVLRIMPRLQDKTSSRSSTTKS
jgi:ubiquinone biosynthesis protein